jgi:hypothetical protein
MTVTYDQLFSALLAMDTYQQGNDGALDTSKLGNNGGIGSASSLSVAGGTDAAHGFFAQAYQLSDGSIVISYRGTDQGFTPLSSPDFNYGYGVGAGAPDAA